MMGTVARVALEGAVFAYDKLYTYVIPPELHKTALAGCRVLVPFGRGNTKKQGIIFSVECDELGGLKCISSLTDREPVLNAEMLKICEYMHDNCFCTYYDAVNAVLPTGLKYKLTDFCSADPDYPEEELDENEKELFAYLLKKGETEKKQLLKKFSVAEAVLENMLEKGAVLKNKNAKRLMRDATEKCVRLSVSSEELESIKLTQRQREIAAFVADAGSVGIRELRYYTGVSDSVVEKLAEKGVLIIFEKQVFRTEGVEKIAKPEAVKLTAEQQAAFDGMAKEYAEPSGAVSLLYGVTGSGKTQVFLKLVDMVSQSGRGVIVTVPEIALTPQMLNIFKSRYGNTVAVFHSAMSLGKRMDEWQRVRTGKAKIAIGTRSAVFAPFEDLGLIIMDEEHEHTYKSEQSPRFHARDIAKLRTAYGKGLLCLASATPSLESFTAASLGKYSLYRLKNRYGNAVLPEVETVDMKKEILAGNAGSISRTLYNAVNDCLNSGKQAILLLNRRGHNTYVSCPECGEVLSCPNCSISLTYHSANNRLMCHYCGYSAQNDGKCPECGGTHLKFMGAGTQKVEEELKAIFPSVRVLRLDADTTLARDSYAERLEAFGNGEYDILLGTQMVAKGLDFANVTLVGVLGADSASFSEDFRSFERTFSLLTQVVGRAGRGENAGRAVIQSLNPESWLINLAAKQDYDGFYNEEILTRKLMVYPPYCDICVVCARSFDKQAANSAINRIFENIKELIKQKYSDIKLIILGPSSPPVARVNNKYRCRIIIKCKNNRRFREMLRIALEAKAEGDVTVSADMNPETVL